jgi:hypothetical protein
MRKNDIMRKRVSFIAQCVFKLDARGELSIRLDVGAKRTISDVQGIELRSPASN